MSRSRRSARPHLPRFVPVAVAAVAAGAAVHAPKAAAQPAWLAPTPFELTATPTLRDAAIGFGGGRELYAVARGEDAQQIELLAREPGAGSGTAPAPLTSFASITGGSVGAPQLAVAPSGAAVVSWYDAASSPGRPLLMRAAYRSPDGAWQQPVTVAEALTSGPSLPGQLPPFGAHLAIGADGTAVVVAEHGEEPTGPELQWDARIDATVHRGGASGWERTTRLSAADRSASSVQVAVAADGAATVAWADRYSVGATDSTDDDDHTAVVRRWGPSNGVWDAPQDVAHAAPSDDADELALGVGDDGAAVLAWARRTRGAIDTVAARRAAGAGGFDTPRLVPTRRTFTAPLAAAVGPDGVATVLWRAPSTTNGAAAGIGANRSAADGAWDAARLLSAYPESRSTGAIARSGADSVLAWSASGGSTQVVQGVRWPAGAATPEATRDIAAVEIFVQLDQLVADGEGGVVALFDGEDGFATAVFDAAPPALRGASVPASAVAGQPLTLSADVIDRWSPLAAPPSWSFDDGGAPAAGATATHVFPAAGDSVVTLHAQDALGNALTRSFAVHVTAPAPAPQAQPQPQPQGRAKPRATLALPRCPARLARPRATSRARCARWRATRAAWRTASGNASGTTRVELRIVTRAARARTTTVVRRAAVRRGRWSLKLPALRAGTVTLTLRPLDARGRPTGTTVVRRVRLR